MRRWLATIVLLGCGSSVESDGSGSTQGEDEAGERPEGNVMYAECESVDDCAPLEFCVFPQSEGGYCSAACTTPTDPSNCAPAPGAAEQSCLDIGLDDDRQVCALDCSDASCPAGMRCEAISTPSGSARDICF